MSLLASPSMTPVLFGLVPALGLLLVLSLGESRTERIAKRARAAAAAWARGPRAGEAEAERPWKARLLDTLSAWGARMPLFNAAQREKVMSQLIVAGARQSRHLSLLITAKFVTGGLFAAIGLFIGGAMLPGQPMLQVAAVFAGLFIGLVLPEMALDIAAKRRQKRLNRALPDALDLLVICTNAGYSLGASLQRVAREIQPVHPALADELRTTADELQVMGDSAAVLRRLAERTRITSIRSLVATLVQTQQYGTPITQSLRTLARSERTGRMLAMEERAAKLSVKITFPMMAFILPVVLIIAAGPAAIKIIQALAE